VAFVARAIVRASAGICLAVSCRMPILSGDRPLATISTALDVMAVAVWTVLLRLATCGSKVSYTRDLFGG
jgi:hypothetical protein